MKYTLNSAKGVGKSDKIMKLDVPYYSQFLDIEDRYWMPRACGIVALKMVLDFYLPAQTGKKNIPPIMELVDTCSKAGGYGKSGWFHDALVSLARSFGLEAYRKEKMDIEDGTREIINNLREGNPVLVSAVKYILGQTKFHMVVATGFEEKNGVLTGIYYHDPEAIDKLKGRHVFVDINTFKREWRKMAIFIHPKVI